MFYTETLYPPATTDDRDLIRCKYNHYLRIAVGVYTVVLRPIGIVKKPYKPFYRKKI